MKGVNKQFVQLIIMDPFRKANIVLETKLYNERITVYGSNEKLIQTPIDPIITRSSLIIWEFYEKPAIQILVK